MHIIKKLIILIVFVIPVSLFAWKMESSTAILPATTIGSSSWQTVTLQQSYDTTPLIFALIDEGNGYNGDSPVALRVRNITTTSFEVVQVEPQSSVGDVEGEHAAVGMHYIAVEAGDHIFGNGTRVLAAAHDTTTKQGKNTSGTKLWDNITYSPAFSSAPVVLSMIQSLNNESSTLPGASSSPWMTVTLRNVDTDSFDVALERAETSTGSITNDETIAYLVIDAGVQGSLYDTTCTQTQYETILTSDSVQGWANGCYSFDFVNTYTGLPNVIGNQESRDGGDGGWLRRCSLSNSAVGVTIDEDQAGDSERSHTTERVGLAIFEKDFVYDSSKTLACKLPLVDYHMDECYWLNSSSTPEDVKDSSANAYNATSSNSASITINTVNPPLCNYGTFSVQPDLVSSDDTTAGNTNAGLSLSVWLNPSAMTNWQAIVTKSKAYNWDDGWGLVHYSGDADNEIRFFINNYSNDFKASLALNVWSHVVVTYDNEVIRIYINGSEYGSGFTYAATVNNSGVGDPLRIAYDANGDDEYIGSVDEVKFWDSVLNAEEITQLYNNENSGKNYSGEPRVCPTCEASIAAHTWEYVGIPADLRTGSYTIADIFGNNMINTYGTDWRVYRRDYSDTNNSSEYTYLSSTIEVLDFGKGYLLGSSNAETWDVNDIVGVDYDSSSTDCPANRCVEIDVKSASLDGDAGDDLLGEGSYRYNLSGFMGKVPVDWADCRFIIDGVAYTPSAAEAEGSVSKTIWQYNPGSGADSNGYTTCDDTVPGGCKLEPYKAFWVELHGSSKGKIVKLLIPQE